LSRFAYVASHDIQEPLRKISAFADILGAAMAENDAEEARYAAQVMATSAQHARRLVADLLTYARAANQSYAVESISIHAALERALDSLSQTIVDQKADIQWFGEDFSVEADKLQLYPAHARTRKSFGFMTRKLSVTESQNSGQHFGTFLRRKSSAASANSRYVA
jgi:light-regulated signal transduction histidine kinase (bacteriophytochrome)